MPWKEKKFWGQAERIVKGARDAAGKGQAGTAWQASGVSQCRWPTCSECPRRPLAAVVLLCRRTAYRKRCPHSHRGTAINRSYNATLSQALHSTRLTWGLNLAVISGNIILLRGGEFIWWSGGAHTRHQASSIPRQPWRRLTFRPANTLGKGHSVRITVLWKRGVLVTQGRGYPAQHLL